MTRYVRGMKLIIIFSLIFIFLSVQGCGKPSNYDKAESAADSVKEFGVYGGGCPEGLPCPNDESAADSLKEPSVYGGGCPEGPPCPSDETIRE